MPHLLCQHCGQPMDVDDSLIGQQITCPQCHSAITVSPRSETMGGSSRIEASPYAAPASAVGMVQQPPKKTRWALLATFLAFCVCLWMKLNTPVSQLDTALGNTGMGGLIGATVGMLLAVVAAALVVGLVVGGIAMLARKPFRSSFKHAYSIAVVLCAGLLYAGQFFLSSVPPRKTAQDAPALPLDFPARFDLPELPVHKPERAQLTELDVPRQNPPAPAKPSPAALSEADQTKADLKELSRISGEYAGAVMAVRSAYDAELAKLEVGELLAPQRVAQDAGFVRSHEVVASALTLIRETHVKCVVALRTLPDRIRASTMSAESQKTAITEAEQELKQSLTAVDKIWDLEEQIMINMEKVLQFLEKSRARWQEKDGEFAFDNIADRAQFAALMTEVDKSVEEQQKLSEPADAATEQPASKAP